MNRFLLLVVLLWMIPSVRAAETSVPAGAVAFTPAAGEGFWSAWENRTPDCPWNLDELYELNKHLPGIETRDDLNWLNYGDTYYIPECFVSAQMAVMTPLPSPGNNLPEGTDVDNAGVDTPPSPAGVGTSNEAEAPVLQARPEVNPDDPSGGLTDEGEVFPEENPEEEDEFNLFSLSTISIPGFVGAGLLIFVAAVALLGLALRGRRRKEALPPPEVALPVVASVPVRGESPGVVGAIQVRPTEKRKPLADQIPERPSRRGATPVESLRERNTLRAEPESLEQSGDGAQASSVVVAVPASERPPQKPRAREVRSQVLLSLPVDREYHVKTQGGETEVAATRIEMGGGSTVYFEIDGRRISETSLRKIAHDPDLLEQMGWVRESV